MKNFLSIFIILLLGTSTLFLGSCKKFKGKSTGNLEFSVDTVVFDTVFTTIGSTTHQFKIYNKESKEVTIDEVELMGGSASKFRINLDGATGTEFSNIKLKGGDSLFCFVEVTLSVNGQTLPMVVEDSIRFQTNGVDQYVKLAVWGQDIYYHYSNIKGQIYDLNEGVWPNDKPHLIYGAAIVDSAKTLDIPAGTHIYMHKNSILYNYKGTLNINGTLGNEVTIEGDRLETDYDNVSGQYYGVYYQQARPSVVNYAIIKNSTAGIHVYSRDGLAPTTTPTVTITNTKIYNAASYGLFLYDEPRVHAENTLIHSNGVHAVIVLQGADFRFTHCDFLGYGAGDQSTPAVGIRNYYTDADGVTYVGDINEGEFRNCVIYGYGEQQLAIDTTQLGSPTINLAFRNCLIKGSSSSNPIFTSCNFNGNPAFSNITDKNFDFTSPGSALNDNGNFTYTTLLLDLGGELRDNPPSIGCYEGP